jgi:hypothetical protein
MDETWMIISKSIFLFSEQQTSGSGDDLCFERRPHRVELRQRGRPRQGQHQRQQRRPRKLLVPQGSQTRAGNLHLEGRAQVSY